MKTNVETNNKTPPNRLESCIRCPFFPDVTNVEKYPYYIGDDGLKHRDIEYVCSYDNHIIINKHKCPRGLF